MQAAPGISVLVITYNQEAYIDRCLEGIAAQSCAQNIQVVLSDDASTDGTVRAAARWKGHIPGLEIHTQPENIGPAGNFLTGLQRCTGEYIAFCEGDDYWIHPKKLHRQVDLLLANPQASMTYCDYTRVNREGIVQTASVLGAAHPEVFTFSDLIFGQGPSINSAMILKDVFAQPFHKSFFEVPNPDVFVFGYALRRGAALYEPFVGSAYRVHGAGIWSSVPFEGQRIIRYGTRMALLDALGQVAHLPLRDALYPEFLAGMRLAFAKYPELYKTYRNLLKRPSRLRIELGQKLRRKNR